MFGDDDNDFGFDDFGDDGEFGEEDFGDSFEDGFSDSFESGDIEDDSSSVISTSIKAIVIGIIVIAIGFVAMRFISNRNKDKDIQGDNRLGRHSEVYDEGYDREQENEYDTDIQESNDRVDDVIRDNEDRDSSSVGYTDGWKRFTASDDIELSDNYESGTFTVTGIKNYVKINSSSNKSLVIKSIVSGNLSGFVGEYELELPYNKANRLNEGDKFSVDIQTGYYGDSRVVGDIKY